jgi:hypothetical protein
MRKIRSKKVGSTGGLTLTYSSPGVITNKTVLVREDYATKEELVTSFGHPFLSRKRPRRKPKPPKPYLGHNHAKVIAYSKRVLAYAKRKGKYDYWKRHTLKADLGGPFESHKVIPQPTFVHMSDRKSLGGSAFQTCEGYFSATNLTRNTNYTIFPSSAVELNALGTIGISKSLPTNPISGLGQFLGELRDLPRAINPQLWEGKADRFRQLARNGSNEYLNVVFGWLPFVNDIIDTLKVLDNHQFHIADYASRSGKHIRRRRQVLKERTTPVITTVTPANAGPRPTPSTLAAGGVLRKVSHQQRRAWFSGAFTYYLPEIDGSVQSYYRRYSAYSHKLYGLSLNPHLLWQLAPWSWAIDWMTNTGHVIRNWQAFTNQGLVMHYGYVMEEKILGDEYWLQGYRMSSCSSPPIVDTRYEVTRVRRAATPYGFGLNPASFSPFQKGVIAALGINFLAR